MEFAYPWSFMRQETQTTAEQSLQLAQEAFTAQWPARVRPQPHLRKLGIIQHPAQTRFSRALHHARSLPAGW